jgi:hypothetical protein
MQKRLVIGVKNNAPMVELVDTLLLSGSAPTGVRVRVPLGVQMAKW